MLIQNLRKFKGIQEEPNKNIGYQLKLRGFPFAFPLFLKCTASYTININLFICDLPHSPKSGVQRKKKLKSGHENSGFICAQLIPQGK